MNPWALLLSALSVAFVVGGDYVVRVLLKQQYDALREAVSWGHIATAVCVLIASTFITSPYGRHAPTTGSDSSPTMSATLSWIIQESPTLVSFAYFNVIAYNGAGVRANLATLLFLVHYVNRTFVYPLKLGGGTPQRVWVTNSALVYCAFNGLLQNAVDSSSNKTTIQIDNITLVVAGAVVFFFGMWANMTVDNYLLSLKKKKQGYLIPMHALFTVTGISCPNFFFEAVEWSGFAICTAGCCGMHSSKTLAAVSFVVFTICNTFPRAVQHHQWYLNKFPKYKALGRKAVVPFLI